MELIGTIGICITIIIVCVSVVLIVFRLTSRKSSFKGSWGNKSIELDGNPILPQETETSAVSAPPLKASEPTKEPETPSPQTEEPEVKTPGISALFSAECIEELESAWSALDFSDRESGNLELWTSYYLQRKLLWGVPGARDALIAAHNDNATWVFPAINLARDAADIADWEKANSYLVEALRRAPSNRRSPVIRNLIGLEYKANGLDAAIKKARDLGRDALDMDSASAIDGILDFDDEAELKESLTIQLLRELRLRNEVSLSHKFSLAYQYASSDDSYNIAFRHYVALDEAGYDKGVVSNNMGVLYGSFGEPFLQIEQYEKGLEGGSTLAGINLAQALTAAGFITRAENLLTTLEDDNKSQANRSSALAEIKRAKDDIVNKRLQIRERTIRPFEEFQQEISAVLKFWKSSTELLDGKFDCGQGTFNTNDYNLSIQQDGKNWTGTLSHHGIFYEGHIKEEGTGLLTHKRSRVLVAPIASDKVSVILFSDLKNRLSVHHLTRSADG